MLQSQSFSQPATDRYLVKAIADFMRANPGCTYEDLRGEHFSRRQIETFAGAAREEAERRSVRRVA